MTNCRNYVVRRFNPKIDKMDLLSLWQRNLQKVPNGRFDWLYNKAQKGTIKTWVLFHNNKLCGTVSLLNFDIESFQKKAKMGFFCDFMVDRRHRTIFPALKLIKFAIGELKKTELDFLLAMPNQSAAVIFSRVGFKPRYSIERWVNLINFHDKIGSMFNLGQMEGMRASIGRFFTYIKKIVTRLLFVNFKKGQSATISLDWLPMIAGKGIRGNSALPPAMIWRYLENPINKYHVFSLQYRDIIIYIIYSIEGREAIIAKIIGWDSEYIGLALYRFAEYLHKQNVDSISLAFVGNHNLKWRLWKSGFVRRPHEGKLYVLGLKEKEMLFESKCILFEGDMDL